MKRSGCAVRQARSRCALACLGGEVVGQLPVDREARVAEIPFAVTDDIRHRGVATLPLEQLVSLAATRHLRAFTTQTLTGELAHGAALVDQRAPNHVRGQLWRERQAGVATTVLDRR
jgi:hypothetical protein